MRSGQFCEFGGSDIDKHCAAAFGISTPQTDDCLRPQYLSNRSVATRSFGWLYDSLWPNPANKKVSRQQSWHRGSASRFDALVLGLPWQRIGEAGVIAVL